MKKPNAHTRFYKGTPPSPHKSSRQDKTKQRAALMFRLARHISKSLSTNHSKTFTKIKNNRRRGGGRGKGEERRGKERESQRAYLQLAQGRRNHDDAGTCW